MQNKRKELNITEKQSLTTDKPRETLGSAREQQQQYPYWLPVELLYDGLTASCVLGDVFAIGFIYCSQCVFRAFAAAVLDRLATPTTTHYYRS